MMRSDRWGWLRASMIAAFLVISATCCVAQQITSQPQSYPASPGYVTGRFHIGFDGIINAATAVATLDTVVFLTPFVVRDYPLTVVNLNTRTVTGIASCAVKMALWATSATTKRPTGVPVVGSNTGQACTANNTNQQVTVTSTVLAPGIYWVGAAVTTGASTFVSSGNTATAIGSLLGQSTVASSTVTGISAPYTYATDIMALNLTAATFTDLFGNQGVPLVFVGN